MSAIAHFSVCRKLSLQFRVSLICAKDYMGLIGGVNKGAHVVSL